jgi:hypothetical protein
VPDFRCLGAMYSWSKANGWLSSRSFFHSLALITQSPVIEPGFVLVADRWRDRTLPNHEY